MNSLKDKVVLVAGGTGFIGLNIVKELLKHPVKEIIVTEHTERKYYYDNILDDKRVRRVLCDLTVYGDCLMAAYGVDAVIMANAVSFGASFIENNPFDLVNDNIVMNVHLLKACWHFGVKDVVYYGSTTGYPLSDKQMVEEDMFKGDPYSKYFGVGWMKRYTEKLIELYSGQGVFNATVLRLSNVYGPCDKFDLDRSHVLPAMVRKFCEKRFPLEVWGDGNVHRDFIYVEDVAEATIKALIYSGGFKACNIGSGNMLPLSYVIQCLREILDLDPVIKYLSDKPQMIEMRQVSVERAKRELGFSATTNLRDGIKLTCEWFMKNKDKIYR